MVSACSGPWFCSRSASAASNTAMASVDFPADSYAAASLSLAITALAWAGPSSRVLVATIDFQYVMAARDSLLRSSDSPVRNSTGWASGFHNSPPSATRSAEAQSRSACSSWSCST
jgi:hypothetical protein